MDTEKCVIESITGGTITCEDDIEAFHFGASSSTNLDGVDIRAEVVLLDRDIKIRAEKDDDWGCRIIVADWLDTGYVL